MTRPKREHGTGSIVQISPNRFRVRVTDTSGVRKNVGTYPTREVAEAVLAGVINGLVEAGRACCGTVSFKDYAEAWLAKHCRTYADKSRVKTICTKARWSRLPLIEVKRRAVHEWLEDMEAEGASRNYVKGFASTLGAIFRRAIRDGIIEDSPSAGHRFERCQDDEAWTYLSKDEIARVLACEQLTVFDRLAFGFLIGTGLRRQEFWMLRDTDLDWGRLEIVVRRGSREGTTKSKRIRRVPLLPIAERSLRAWLDIRDDMVGANPLGLVWPGIRGGMRIDWWNNFAERCSKLASVREFRQHDLRHTFAASLVSGYWGRRWRLEEIRPLLGHSSIQETERYAHLAESALTQAVQEHRDQQDWSLLPGFGEAGRDKQTILTITNIEREVPCFEAFPEIPDLFETN